MSSRGAPRIEEPQFASVRATQAAGARPGTAPPAAPQAGPFPNYEITRRRRTRRGSSTTGRAVSGDNPPGSRTRRHDLTLAPRLAPWPPRRARSASRSTPTRSRPGCLDMAGGNVAALSRGEFGAVAVPRILDLPARHELLATFFIPGPPSTRSL